MNEATNLNPRAETGKQEEKPIYILDIGKIFAEFGLKRGEPAPLSAVLALFRKYGEKLAAQAPKNFWRILQTTLFDGQYATPRQGNWFFLANEFADFRQAQRQAYMGWKFFDAREKDLPAGADRNIYFLEFVFEKNPKVSTRKFSTSLHEIYLPEALVFRNLRLRCDNYRHRDRDFCLNLDDEQLVERLPEIMVDTTALVNALSEVAIDLEEDFPEARRQIFEFFRKNQGADRVGVRSKFEKFYQAIKEFGNYEFAHSKKRTRADLIGSCLVVPYEFSSFCRLRYGIELEVFHYGLPDLTGMDEAEEDFVCERTKKTGTYHKINVFDRRLAIDWTGRQFGATFRGRPTGFPAIYELTDAEKEELFSDFRGRPR
jgi:hypothetical protein